MIENFGDKRGIAGFDKHPQNINSNGRPPSFRKALNEMLGTEGGIIRFDKSDCQILDDEVIVTVPSKAAICLKLVQWAMSGKSRESLKAIELIIKNTHNPMDDMLDLTETIKINLNDE